MFHVWFKNSYSRWRYVQLQWMATTTAHITLHVMKPLPESCPATTPVNWRSPDFDIRRLEWSFVSALTFDVPRPLKVCFLKTWPISYLDKNLATRRYVTGLKPVFIPVNMAHNYICIRLLSPFHGATAPSVPCPNSNDASILPHSHLNRLHPRIRGTSVMHSVLPSHTWSSQWSCEIYH